MRLEDLPEQYRRQAEAQIRGCTPAVRLAGENRHGEPDQTEKHAGGRSGRATRALNKTEIKFKRDMLDRLPGIVLDQALVLDFGDGTSYRPDFIHLHDGKVTIYEVKGGHVGKVAWSRHGIERFRRAREKWGAFMSFELWRLKDHTWEKL